MGRMLTIKDIAKQVAKEAMSSLEVNDMPLEEFIVNVGFTNAQELTINHIRFCKKLLEMMNIE